MNSFNLTHRHLQPNLITILIKHQHSFNATQTPHSRFQQRAETNAWFSAALERNAGIRKGHIQAP